MGDRDFPEQVIRLGQNPHLISNDTVLAHPDVKRRAQAEGIRLTTVTTIQEALPLLKSALDEGEQRSLDSQTQHLRNYLLSERDLITVEVGKQATVSPLTFGMYKADRIKGFQFLDIMAVVTAGFPEETPDGERVHFGFAVAYRTTVSGYPTTLPAPPPPLSLEGPPAEEVSPLPQPAPFGLTEALFGRPTPVDVTEDVAFTVQASAVFHRANKQYSDLRIEKVNPASAVVTRMLRKTPDWVSGSEKSGQV